MNQNTFRIQKIKTQVDMDEFVAFLDLKSPKVIVKPNWVSYQKGTYTDARVLDMFLTAVKRPTILAESYTFWRTDKKVRGEGDYFSSKEANLKTGKDHWDFFKKQDGIFLNETGIGKVLKKHNAEYLNITNEVWGGKTASPHEVKTIVESKYAPVSAEDLYSYIPNKIYELKGYDMISFSKAKIDSSYGASLSIKNLFGLIPDPTRYEKYHGGDTEHLLTQSIIDANKIYRSLFNTKFVVEGVFEHCSINWDTEIATPILDWGVIIGGSDALEVDTIANKLLKTNFAGAIKDLSERYKRIINGNDSVDITKYSEYLI
ncbi:MAG: DUF362 domain-containing protein [Patescibacteria group bacterium]